MPPDRWRDPGEVTVPHQGQSAVDVTTGSRSVARPADDAGWMRRRRDAALRLPLPASGHRDPLDKLAGLPITDRDDCCRGQFGAGGKWQQCCRGAA